MKRLLLYPMLLLGLVSLAFSGNIIISNNGIQINGSNVCLVGGSYSFGALTVTTLNGYSVNQFVSASNNSCPTGSLCVQSGNVTDFKAQVLACNASSYCSQVLVPAGVYNVVNELNFTNVNNTFIYGNTLKNIGGNCIEFGGTGGRTYNTFLTNNHCYNWHQNAVGADNGIDSNGEFGVAIGNVLFSNGTVDCYSTTASQLNKSNNVCQGVFS